MASCLAKSLKTRKSDGSRNLLNADVFDDNVAELSDVIAYQHQSPDNGVLLD